MPIFMVHTRWEDSWPHDGRTLHNCLVLALTKRNSNVMGILLFLHRVVGVFTEYFRELEEESLRDNFVIVYELLDEMMDFGHVQSTETNILKE